MMMAFFIVTLLITLVSFFTGDHRKSVETSRSVLYASRLYELDRSREALKSIKEFLDQQEAGILDSQRTLDSLKQEQARLGPMVAADRATIEAFLIKYDDRKAKDESAAFWKGCVISFCVGVMSSLSATWIQRRFRLSRERDKHSQQEPNP